MASSKVSTDLPKDLILLRDEIRQYALDYGLDFFDVAFELVDHDQINSVAALGGFPVRYPHWRFGMEYDQLSKTYTYGLQKIYELVINNDPAYAYLMRANTTVDQKIVMAHVYGHVDFFKNNQWFSKTNRKMIDTMANHALRIRGYMERYGVDCVESFMDRCLSLENLIDPYLPFQVKKNAAPESALNAQEAPEAQVMKFKAPRSYLDSFMNPPEFIEAQKKKAEEETQGTTSGYKKVLGEPQRDILKFLLESAPLESWENDILSMVREEAYYFAPQWQTKILNEGWASYWHSTIMTTKALRDSEIVDYADHHAGVTAMQPGRMNPYKLGIELLRDIEDRWNKGKFGPEYDNCKDMKVLAQWDKKLGLGRKKIFEVRRVCNDVTFIDEYLTPEFCDRLKLYTYQYNRRTQQYEIVDRDFKNIKQKLLFSLTNMGQPIIHAIDGNYQNKGELLLLHKHEGVDLDTKWARETLHHIAHIWRRPVYLETVMEGQKKLISTDGKDYFEKVLEKV